MNDIIYLDNNSTTRMDEAVLEAMLPFMRERFGNPASGHAFGRAALDAVEQARSAVARLIGGGSGRVVFTASATEANNLAITGLTAMSERPCHVVASSIEHKSVLEPLRRLEAQGRVRTTLLRPDPFGQVQPAVLQDELADDTRVVSIIAAHNVIHTLNPLAELARVCAGREILLHCDATQWVGRLPMDAQRLGIDALSISAHKLYGPKGVGALWLSRRALHSGIVPQILGGGQEERLRSGTLNVPAIVGFGAACDLASQRQVPDATHAKQLADLLWTGLAGQIDRITRNGHPEQRLPGGLHITLEGVDSKGLIAAVPEVAFSDGSACETDRDADYVLKAIGRPEAAHHSVRFQVGRTTTRDEIESAVQLLVAGIVRMRDLAV